MSYTAWGSLNLPTCWIWYMRSPPFTYSMTKYRRSCDHRDEGNRREESGIDGEYAISLFCAKKLKKSTQNFYVSTCWQWSKQRRYQFSIASRPNLAVWVVPSFLLHFPWQGDLKSPQQSASWKKKTLNTDICQDGFSLWNSAGPLPPMTTLAWPWSSCVCQSLTSKTQSNHLT